MSEVIKGKLFLGETLIGDMMIKNIEVKTDLDMFHQTGHVTSEIKGELLINPEIDYKLKFKLKDTEYTVDCRLCASAIEAIIYGKNMEGITCQ